jgi:predicted nucleic acid-binding protein
MGEKIILDTTMLIDIFDKRTHIDILENECRISIVSVYEYIRYKKEKQEQKLFLEDAFEPFNLTNPILLKASDIFISLKSKGLRVSENDIYIAATAICTGHTLYAKDKDFSTIKNVSNELKLAMIT